MNDIVLLALAEEAPELSKQPFVFVTGVGKVNAALNAARLIERHRPMRVWNFGTAGGITVGAGIHKCTRFVQRDMDVTPLGFALGQTPYEPGVIIEMGHDGLVCGSGDSFVTNPALTVQADLVEMEAFAIAKACTASGIPFLCYKFITDQADGASSNDWQENIHKGEPHYVSILKEHGVLFSPF